MGLDNWGAKPCGLLPRPSIANEARVYNPAGYRSAKADTSASWRKRYLGKIDPPEKHREAAA